MRTIEASSAALHGAALVVTRSPRIPRLENPFPDRLVDERQHNKEQNSENNADDRMNDRLGHVSPVLELHRCPQHRECSSGGNKHIAFEERDNEPDHEHLLPIETIPIAIDKSSRANTSLLCYTIFRTYFITYFYEPLA